MKKLKFTAEMFADLFPDTDSFRQAMLFSAKCVEISDRAQAIYDKHLEGLPKVYRFRDEQEDGTLQYLYDETKQDFHTHTFRLDDMREIKD